MLTAITALLIVSLVWNVLVVVVLYRDKTKWTADRAVTFNQLCAANNRLGAIISMLGYKLDDVERFAKESLYDQSHFMEGRDAGAGEVTAAFIPNPDVTPPLQQIERGNGEKK